MRVRTTLTVLGLTAAGILGAIAPATADDGIDPVPPVSSDVFGTTKAEGGLAPQLSLLMDSLNKLCLGLTAMSNVQGVANVTSIVKIGPQDVPSAPQPQPCALLAPQAKGNVNGVNGVNGVNND
ncbi:RdlA protein [Streptomyces sp. NPDC046465]|uniref:RdlA protein n=1 Tax=Streptomyces sp. NPDC046465 TaxID=3155810 RepID=UPI0033F61C61